MNKKIVPRKFKTAEELRGAIVRRHISDERQATVIFVGPKAMAEIASNTKPLLYVGKGVWKNWSRVKAVRSDEHLLQFEETDDGERMFFYELS